MGFDFGALGLGFDFWLVLDLNIFLRALTLGLGFDFGLGLRL